MQRRINVNTKPYPKQLRNAILIGVAKAIVAETQQAYRERSQGSSYQDAPDWAENSEAWTARKASEGRSTDIGVYTGELSEEVFSLSYKIDTNNIRITLNTEHAEYFNANRPIIYIPPTSVIQEYIAESIREATNGS